MINVTNHITVKLRQLFTDKATIYTEQKESGFKEPAFFVFPINVNSADKLARREMRSYGYQIVYFPEQKRINADIEVVAAQLLDNFTKLDGFAQVTDRDFTIQDKCLLFTFNVRVFTKVVDAEELMEKLKQEGRVIDGRFKGI